MIFKIFEDVFGGDERLIRLLPSQAAVPYVKPLANGIEAEVRFILDEVVFQGILSLEDHHRAF